MIPATTSGYVHKDRLCLIGVVNTSNGIIPFAHHCQLEESVPDGPVNIGSDELPAVIAKAVDNSTHAIQTRIDKERLKLVIENLVERARLCDQNAVAILVQIRENAKKGIPRALDAYAACRKYIKLHPVTDKSFFAGEPAPALEMPSPIRLLSTNLAKSPNENHYAAIVAAFVPNTGTSIQSVENTATVLANGPVITEEMIKRIVGMIDKKEIFFIGLTCDEDKAKELAVKVSPDGRKALQLGYAVGLARKLQDLRNPDSLISNFSKDIAWELGE